MRQSNCILKVSQRLQYFPLTEEYCDSSVPWEARHDFGKIESFLVEEGPLKMHR